MFTIPNLFTSLNILSGCIAVVLALSGKNNLALAPYFIILAAFFDFFDGFFARLLKSYSELGKQLDSLADMVSFGLAPSVIVFRILMQSLRIKEINPNIKFLDMIILASAFLIAIFSAFRLAKFNLDTRQTDSFIGLATPANAIFFASFPLITNFDPSNLILLPQLADNIYFFLLLIGIETSLLKLYVLLPIIFIFSFLLISEFPMFALKFKSYKFSENKLRYFFILSSLLLFVFFQSLAFPVIIVNYIFLSAIRNFVNHRKEVIAKRNLQKILAKK